MSLDNNQQLGIEFEEHFIGGLLQEGDLISEVKLPSNALLRKSNRIIFEAMLEINEAGDTPDLVTVVARLAETGMLDALEGQLQQPPITYMAGLMEKTPHAANLKFLEQKIYDGLRMRVAKRAAKGFQEMPNEENFGKLLSKLQEVETMGISKVTTLQSQVMGVLEELMKPKTGEVTGYDTGYTELNKMTSGFQRRQFSIIAARPSVGKTALILNIIRNGLRLDPKSHHIVFSIEMGANELLLRMACIIAQIPQQKVKDKNLDSDDWTRINKALDYLAKSNLTIIDDTSISVNEMRGETKRIMKEFGDDRNYIVYIDYLTLIRYDGEFRTNKVIQLGEIGNGLKAIAKNFNIPVICLAQLSRGVEGRQDKRPSMSDIRDSGELEQIADLIICLYREDYYDRETENKNVIELIIDKQRSGATGTVELAFIKEYGVFVNLDRRHDDSQAS